jgi:heme a synthase
VSQAAALRAFARRDAAPRTFLVVALVSVATLWLVVVTGGIVRLTASGLGCPSWPLCEEGKVVPAASYHAAIEFGNRVISGLAIGGVAAAALVAHRVRGLDRRVRRGALLAALGTAAQAPLGALTVLSDLHPLAVMSHFLLALAVVAVAVWVAYRAWLLDRGEPPQAARDADARLAQAALAAVLVLVTTGAFVTAAGPHAGSFDRPIDRLGDLHDAAWVHVRVAVAFCALVAALTRRLRRARGPAFRLAVVTAALAAVQFGIGEYQYRNGLPWGVVAVHVSVAVTLVCATVLTACETTYRGPARAGATAREPSAAGEPPVADVHRAGVD